MIGLGDQNEVVAVVRLRDGHEATDEDLRRSAAEHVARYKLPKRIVRVGEIVRSPSGKADYRWARHVAGTGWRGVWRDGWREPNGTSDTAAGGRGTLGEPFA